ncbi:Kiwa anti-phage protein KwaB-like domain-containing protein [Lactococcus taiwanensis]|uniref:Kiwa anti-phage protein KwaB-like domain-containing protein n=1 Tax=Lactococcus taiwanensis TaxID=1151742 RepID=UPI0028A5A7DD|nr:Kiwa anti-phage protein KwaB-like domain-containing protein [Lactococcus taiwanensis]
MLDELKNLLEQTSEQRFSRFHFKIKEAEKPYYLDFGNDENRLSEEFKMAQLRAIDEILKATEDNNILNLALADERKDAIYYLENESWENEFISIRTLVTEVNEEDLSKYDENDFTDIDYFISRIDLPENKGLTTFKVVYPVQTIYTQTTMFKKDNKYKKPENNLFRIPQNFDFFVFDDVLYVNNIKAFERKNSPHLIEFRKRETEKSMTIIESKNILSKETCATLKKFLEEDERLARKIVRARERLENSSKAINEIAVISYIRDSFSGYDLINDGKLNLITKKNAKDFINVFCDEYLRSGLTGNAYDIKASNILKEGTANA